MKIGFDPIAKDGGMTTFLALHCFCINLLEIYFDVTTKVLSRKIIQSTIGIIILGFYFEYTWRKDNGKKR